MRNCDLSIGITALVATLQLAQYEEYKGGILALAGGIGDCLNHYGSDI